MADRSDSREDASPLIDVYVDGCGAGELAKRDEIISGCWPDRRFIDAVGYSASRHGIKDNESNCRTWGLMS